MARFSRFSTTLFFLHFFFLCGCVSDLPVLVFLCVSGIHLALFYSDSLTVFVPICTTVSLSYSSALAIFLSWTLFFVVVLILMVYSYFRRVKVCLVCLCQCVIFPVKSWPRFCINWLRFFWTRLCAALWMILFLVSRVIGIMLALIVVAIYIILCLVSFVFSCCCPPSHRTVRPFTKGQQLLRAFHKYEAWLVSEYSACAFCFTTPHLLVSSLSSFHSYYVEQSRPFYHSRNLRMPDEPALPWSEPVVAAAASDSSASSSFNSFSAVSLTSFSSRLCPSAFAVYNSRDLISASQVWVPPTTVRYIWMNWCPHYHVSSRTSPHAIAHSFASSAAPSDAAVAISASVIASVAASSCCSASSLSSSSAAAATSCDSLAVIPTTVNSHTESASTTVPVLADSSSLHSIQVLFDDSMHSAAFYTSDRTLAIQLVSEQCLPYDAVFYTEVRINKLTLSLSMNVSCLPFGIGFQRCLLPNDVSVCCCQFCLHCGCVFLLSCYIILLFLCVTVLHVFFVMLRS